jgi:hypothetical protein
MERKFTLFAIAAMLTIMVIVPIAALAQGVDPGEEITLGGYAIPPLITILLMIAFNFLGIGDRWKPLIAIGLGVALSLLAIPYLGKAWTVVVIIDHTLYGMMAGCASVGLYEGQKAFRKSHRG